MTIDVILFDLGGVLVELTGVPTMLGWTGRRFNEERLWEAWLGSPAVRAFETGETTAEQFAAQIIAEMDLPVGETEFIAAFKRWPRGLFPGVPDLLERLRPCYTLACLSNSNRLHWPLLMEEMGLGKMLHHHFASHLIHKLKPDAEAYAHVLEALECSGSAVLFLDDNAVNVSAARAAGIHARRVRGPVEIEGVLRETGLLGWGQKRTRSRPCRP